MADRFHSKIEKTENCWLWKACKNRQGYGQFRDGKLKIAHRHMYEITHDVVLGRWDIIMHTCDNTSCVNPDHLKMGTQKENILDASTKNRLRVQSSTHCKNGHEYVEGSYTLVKQKRWTYKRCKVCRRKNSH